MDVVSLPQAVANLNQCSTALDAVLWLEPIMRRGPLRL